MTRQPTQGNGANHQQQEKFKQQHGKSEWVRFQQGSILPFARHGGAVQHEMKATACGFVGNIEAEPKP